MTDAPGPDIPDVTGLLLDTDSLEEFLHALAQSALDLAPESDGCGVTLEREGRPLTVASVGSSAPNLDEAQYGRDDGPCLQAMRRGEEVSVTDMLGEQRWGDYSGYALACGARSSLSLPIAPHTHTAGALNLYSPKPKGFADADMSALRSLAAQATGAIALAQRIADGREFTTDLQAALRTRTVIDQAIGVLIGQERCTAEEAFALLRRASQSRNLKIRNLCEELVTGITGQPPTEAQLRPRP